ncbi:MAG: hypothetical protein LBJ16_03990 [Holosporaceae bacterium]|nr:hypothetical protein [Holosporaceae bacterium]
MYTAVLRSVCSYKFLEISLFGKKSNATRRIIWLSVCVGSKLWYPISRACSACSFWERVYYVFTW